MYIEDSVNPLEPVEDSTCFSALKTKAIHSSGSDIYKVEGEDIDPQSVQLSFWVPTPKIFGLPEREDTLELKRTTGTDPYELFATDHLHMPGSKGPLYGSIPYVSGINEKSAMSMLWVNSARTLIDIDDMPMESVDESGDKSVDGSLITFSSEAGAMEFFVFASGAKEGMNRA